MHLVRTIGALALVVSFAGCTYPRTQTQYSPNLVETPQPVEFFQGTLIDSRPASFEYGTSVGIGAAYVPTYPYFAGLTAGGKGGTAGIGGAFGGVAVLAAGTVPEIPATEYTVCLAAPGATSAMIVVQNEFPARYPNDVAIRLGEPVLVRVVGGAGRVMRRLPADPTTTPPPTTPPQVSGGVPTVPCFPANGPMQVPLGSPGYTAAPAAPADTHYHPHWIGPTAGY
jgi:outer membrane lipoprotein SlyB